MQSDVVNALLGSVITILLAGCSLGKPERPASVPDPINPEVVSYYTTAERGVPQPIGSSQNPYELVLGSYHSGDGLNGSVLELRDDGTYTKSSYHDFGDYTTEVHGYWGIEDGKIALMSKERDKLLLEFVRFGTYVALGDPEDRWVRRFGYVEANVWNKRS